MTENIVVDRIRFGYHGSVEVARRILRLARRPDDDTGLTENVELSQYDVADPFARLRGGDLDVMTVKFGLREPDLDHSAVLDTDARAAVLGAHHPLAGRASVSIEELAEYDSFDRPGRMPGYIWDEVVPPRTPGGRAIRRVHRLSDAAAMMDLVSRTDSVHISLVSLADIAPPSVRVVPIDDLPPAPVSLAWRANDVPPAVLRLVRTAEAAALRSPR